MSLENRLKELGKQYSVSMDTVLSMYEGRYKVLKLTYGTKYIGRDSHLRVKAFQGLAMYLKNRYEKK